MRRTAAAVMAVAAMSLLTTGCGPQWTVFEFQNVTDDERIWVHDLQPLTNSPPCGNLGPGARATGHMSRQEIPAKLNISWRPMTDEDRVRDMFDETEWTETEIAVSNYDQAKSRDWLLLEYQGDGVWDATFTDAKR